MISLVDRQISLVYRKERKKSEVNIETKQNSYWNEQMKRIYCWYDIWRAIHVKFIWYSAINICCERLLARKKERKNHMKVCSFIVWINSMSCNANLRQSIHVRSRNAKMRHFIHSLHLCDGCDKRARSWNILLQMKYWIFVNEYANKTLPFNRNNIVNNVY